MKNKFLLASLMFAFFVSPASAQVASIDASGFSKVVVHAANVISMSGASRVHGDISVSPGANVSILPPSFVSGAKEQNTSVAMAVAASVSALYNELSMRPCEFNMLRDSGNTTYTPGSYCAVADVFFRGETIFDAQGNPNAIFLIQAAANFTTADNSTMKLVNGAKWENIYFVAGTYSVLGRNTTLKGTLITANNVTVGESAVVTGRVASKNGSVDLISAVVGAGAAADLSLAQSVSSTTAAEGELIVYTLTVANAGPDVATGVVVWDAFPESFELVNASASIGSFAGSEWALGSLSAGASAKLEVTMRPKSGSQGSTYKNTAEIKSSNAVDGDSQPGNMANGEDDFSTLFVTVGAPRPVSQIPLNWYSPASERDAVRNIDENQTLAVQAGGSVGPVTLPCTPGTLFRGSFAAVYYCSLEGKRLVFPDDRTYMTWYADFSKVIKISDTALAKIPLSGLVRYRPGVKLVKIQTDPRVYAVSRNGVLRHIGSEAVAVQLYGPNWSKLVEDIPDAFFFNYSIGEPIVSQ